VKRIGAVGDCKKVHRPAPAPSAVLKPVPATVTPVPIGPPVGLTVITGAFDVTVKVADPVSPVIPVTVIVYTPGVAAAAIVNPLVTN